VAHERQAFEEATRLLEKSLHMHDDLGNQAGVASTLHELGVLSHSQGKNDKARRLYQRSLELAEALENGVSIVMSLGQLAGLAEDEGDFAEAERLYLDIIERDELREAFVPRGMAMFNLALLYARLDFETEALVLLEQAKTLLEETDLPYKTMIDQLAAEIRAG
jgi:tetratricopeptide (TPR) repeat protein